MDAVLIGGSDRSKLFKAGKVSEKAYPQFVDDYAWFLADKFENVIVVPNDGAYTDMALAFGAAKGKKPVAYYPSKDTQYGIKHIEKNFPLYELRPVDGDWYKVNAELTKQALAVICFGIGTTSLIEMAHIKYHQTKGAKKNPELKNIHLLIDKRCITEKLPKCLEESISNIYYYSSLNELSEIVNKIE